MPNETPNQIKQSALQSSNKRLDHYKKMIMELKRDLKYFETALEREELNNKIARSQNA
jgi:hypothetical protein